MDCPRCHKTHFNTFKISRYSIVMPVNKCIVCGYLWIDDEDLKGLAKVESQNMFIKAIRELGKNDQRKDTS